MNGPIGLAPFQLVTLLSPAFPLSSSTPSSPVKQRPTSPTQLTPSNSLTDRLSTFVAGTPTQPEASTSAVPTGKAGTVRSVDAGGDRVWVGGSDGRVRVYQVGEREGGAGAGRPLSPSMLSQVGNATLGEAVDEVVVGGGKAVDRLVCLSGLELGLVLSEGVLSFYSLSTLSPLTGPGFAPLRGVSTFALDEAQLSSLNPFTSIQLVIIKRKTLQLLNFTKEGVNPVRDLPLPGGAVTSVLRRNHVCIANKETYAIIDIVNGSLIELLPISQAPILDEAPTSSSAPDADPASDKSTTPPPPGIDPRQRPAIACVDSNEFLVASHNGASTIGIFFTEAGDPCRGTLDWGSNLRALTIDGPYAVALLHNHTVEVHSLQTLEIVQLVQLPNAGSPASLQPKALARSWKGLHLGPKPGQSKSDLISIALLGGSGGYFDSTPTRTPGKRSVDPAATATRTLVLGKNSVYALAPLTLVVQADALLDNGRAEEALSLAEGIERSSSDGAAANPDLGYVYLRAAYIALAGMRFQDGFELFLRAKCDPRLAVRMFPELREPLIGGKDQVEVWAGLASEVGELRSVDDYILSNLAKNYAPHLKPDVESAESTVELRQALNATARDCLTAYLTKWRAARRSGSAELGTRDSRKVDMVVDTTLVRLLAEQGLAGVGALAKVLDGANDVVLPQVEPALLAGGLHDLLSTILEKRGETTRVLDLWSKIVEGEYSLPAGVAEDLYVQKVYEQVAKSTEVDVVVRWAVWLMPRDRGLALKLVTDPKQPLKFNTRDLFARFAKVDQAGADLFLETVVLTGRDGDTSLHVDLVTRAVDRVGELLDNLDTRTFAKAQEADFGTGDSGANSFLSFLVDRYDPAALEADFSRARLKAILLLSTGSAYDPAQVKGKVDELAARSGALTLERAVVYGKLRLDRQALALLVHGLRDLGAAGRYVRQAGDPLAAGEVKAVAAALGLPAKALGGRKKAAAAAAARRGSLAGPGGDEAALARMLVEMSLARPAAPAQGVAFPPGVVAKLLEAQAAHVEAAEVVGMMPEEWPIELVRPYLEGALRRSLHGRQEGMLLKAVARGENLEVAWKVGEAGARRRGVLQRASQGGGGAGGDAAGGGTEEVVQLGVGEGKEDGKGEGEKVGVVQL